MSPKDEIESILVEINDATRPCVGRGYSKSVGAVTAQVIREHLIGHGLSMSARDVFIRGLGVEIDLLLTTPDAHPSHGIVYDPKDVVAALEIKRSGAFSSSDTARLKDNFRSICRHIGRRAPCAYVTVQERNGYIYAPKSCDEYTVFCLAWYDRDRDRDKPTPCDDWGKLLDWLKLVNSADAARVRV